MNTPPPRFKRGAIRAADLDERPATHSPVERLLDELFPTQAERDALRRALDAYRKDEE